VHDRGVGNDGKESDVVERQDAIQKEDAVLARDGRETVKGMKKYEHPRGGVGHLDGCFCWSKQKRVE